MDAPRFDRLARTMASSGPRRTLLRRLAPLPLVGLLNAFLDEGSALAQHRRRTVHHRHDRLHEQRQKKKKCAKAGQTISKKHKKCCPGLDKDPSGRCTRCSLATCPLNRCGSLPDGCGGTLSCGCSVNQVCLRSGTCQACTVTCTGTPAQCGTALQTALNGGGTVYVCPGRYQGSFTVSNAVMVVGAGEGPDAGNNTILDAAGAGRVLKINALVGSVALERLRLTGGNASGINHDGTMLRMTECTVSGNTSPSFGGIFTRGTLELTRCTIRDNHATGQFGAGGGIGIYGGNTTLTDCLIEANSADSEGGGLYLGTATTTTLTGTQVRGNLAFFGAGISIVHPSATLAITEDCQVTQNVAPSGHGGGIYVTDGAVALFGPDPSPIVVNNCHENCAPMGDVAKCAATPVSC